MRRLSVLLVCVLAVATCRPAPLPAERAILVLVSIDGFRWDYLDRYQPPQLSRLAANGVRAEALIPQFPTKTFPNHYTIVTGLRLANHGIISNNMRAADIPGEFSMSHRDVIADSRWWGGEPIWNTATKQGRIAAAMFWPGSETVIAGGQPRYWTPYDHGFPNPERVKKVLEWLAMPEAARPSLLMLYFASVDDAGHNFGPESREVRDAVHEIDRLFGDLVSEVNRTGLADRVHYVIVSDHGMAALSTDRVIVLDKYIDLSTVDVIDWEPVLGVSPKDGNVDKLYAALKDKHPNLHVYRSGEIPPEYRLAGHPRLPAVIGIADEGWNITSAREVNRWDSHERQPPRGTHGYDARAKSMHGVFIASGPRIRSGMVVPPFENIHVYDFMCALLGLTPAKNDGDPAVTRDMLR